MKKGRNVCHLLDRRETIQVGQRSRVESVKACRASEGTRTLEKSPSQPDATRRCVGLPRTLATVKDLNPGWSPRWSTVPSLKLSEHLVLVENGQQLGTRTPPRSEALVKDV